MRPSLLASITSDGLVPAVSDRARPAPLSDFPGLRANENEVSTAF